MISQTHTASGHMSSFGNSWQPQLGARGGGGSCVNKDQPDSTSALIKYIKLNWKLVPETAEESGTQWRVNDDLITGKTN